MNIKKEVSKRIYDEVFAGVDITEKYGWSKEGIYDRFYGYFYNMLVSSAVDGSDDSRDNQSNDYEFGFTTESNETPKEIEQVIYDKFIKYIRNTCEYQPNYGYRSKLYSAVKDHYC